MRLVHRWSGDCVGWLEGPDLFGVDGRHLGRLKGEEVYAPDARYVAEFREGRMVTDVRKCADRLWMSFAALPRRRWPAALSPCEAERDMPQGCIDFQPPMAAAIVERKAA